MDMRRLAQGEFPYKSSNPITGGMQVPMPGFQGQVSDLFAILKVSTQCLRIQRSFQWVWNGGCPNHCGILSCLQAMRGSWWLKCSMELTFSWALQGLFRHVSTCARASETWYVMWPWCVKVTWFLVLYKYIINIIILYTVVLTSCSKVYPRRETMGNPSGDGRCF